MFKNLSNPVKIIIGLSVAALGLVGYYIYTILDTFSPTAESSNIPVEIQVDNSVVAGQQVNDDFAPSKPAIWSQTLTDLGNKTLKDSYGNLYYVDPDGNIINDEGDIFDDATGEVLKVN
jgi:hypothetical protein